MATWISWTGIIPDDLVLEILLWLPMKSLVRFRCVSKTWNSLIFNPDFVKLHLEKSSKNTPMLSIWRRRIEGSSFLVSFCSIPGLIQNPAPYFHNNTRRYRFPHYNLDNNLVGTSNGLLCMHHSRFNIFGYEKHRFSFQNPATRTPYRYSPSLSFYCRIFPESDYKLSYGFGYDDRRHTYKVVAMVLDSHTKRSSVRVHDMGDKCWRRTVINFPAFETFDSNGYFLNDSVNWIGISFEEPEIEKLQIFSYDLKNDTYRYLSVPEVVPKNSTLTSLGVLNGCLYVSFNDRQKYFVVLVLKDVRDETSWIRLLSISFERLSIASLRMPVFFTVYGDMLLLIRMCNCIIFNLKDNKVERTQPFHIDTPVFDCDILSFDYVPSLISPV